MKSDYVDTSVTSSGVLVKSYQASEGNSYKAHYGSSIKLINYVKTGDPDSISLQINGKSLQFSNADYNSGSDSGTKS
jgi:hypothetical protein